MRREMESLAWDVRRRGGLDVDSELVLSLDGESKEKEASVRSSILSAATANFSVAWKMVMSSGSAAGPL